MAQLGMTKTSDRMKDLKLAQKYHIEVSLDDCSNGVTGVPTCWLRSKRFGEYGGEVKMIGEFCYVHNTHKFEVTSFTILEVVGESCILEIIQRDGEPARIYKIYVSK